MKAALFSVLALSLAGCASIGTNYNPEIAASIQPGASKDEVVRLLGPPNAITTMADGREILVWVHSQANGLTGSAKARSVRFIFGEDGRMQRPVGTTQTQSN